jgi:KaiC/GvpD/RAD55 family RecA-like ATPase
MATEKVRERNSLTLVRGENYIALPRDPQPWIIEKIVPSGGVMIVYGAPKEGKSYMALGMAIAIANENVHGFLGHAILKHGPVVYLQVDTPREEWASRVERVQDEGIENIYWTDANLVPYPFTVTDPETRHALKAKILELKPVVLIVDTLREVHCEDEDNNTAMKNVLTNLKEVVNDTNTTLILVAHARKSGQKRKDEAPIEDDLMNDLRGASYVTGRCDIVSKMSNSKFLVRGRSIANTVFHIEQDQRTLLWRLKDQAAEHAKALNYVMTAPELKSDNDRLRMLKAMTGLDDDASLKTQMTDWRPL